MAWSTRSPAGASCDQGPRRRLRVPGHPVLRGLSIDIDEGLTTVVVGASGIGKSVLLKCIDRPLRPQSGSITIDDDEVVGADRRTLLVIRRRSACSSRRGPFSIPWMSSRMWRSPWSTTSRAPPPRDRAQGARLPGPRGDAGLGKGDAHRAFRRHEEEGCVARAMILEPRYLLYDEPTSGLDPASSAIVESMMKGSRRSGPSRHWWSPTTSISPATSRTGSRSWRTGGS